MKKKWRKFNPSHSYPGRKEKINWNFYFQTSFESLKKFNEDFYGFHKTFWGTRNKGDFDFDLFWLNFLKSKNSQPTTIFSGTKKKLWCYIFVKITERKRLSFAWIAEKGKQCILKNLDARLVKYLLERNIRSVDVIFRKKNRKKWIACIETDSVINKMKFFRWEKVSFQGEIYKVELKIKTFFQNFLPWWYHMNSKM